MTPRFPANVELAEQPSSFLSRFAFPLLAWGLVLHSLIIAALFGWFGLPEQAVRVIAAWKEVALVLLIILVIVRAATGHGPRTGRREVLAHRDGVTIDASGASRFITIAGKMLPDLDVARTDRVWLSTTRDVHTAATPVFGMILVQDRLDMAQAIAAGRAWQRLHLAMTAQGLAARPLNQPLEMIDRNTMLGRNDEFGAALATLARTAGWVLLSFSDWDTRCAKHRARRAGR